MAFARTILALLIALSVALLPAASIAAFKFKSQEMTEMSASEPMDDCCPHAASPCDKAMGDCASMAACTLNCLCYAGGCLCYAGGLSSQLLYPVTLADTLPLFESGVLHSQRGSPPFRPPRV